MVDKENPERLFAVPGSENLKITALYAWIATEPDGGEGIPAIFMQGAWMPMLGADMERIRSLRAEAVSFREKTGQPVRLVRFSKTEDLEVLP